MERVTYMHSTTPFFYKAKFFHFFSNEPGLVLNLFLIFGRNPGWSSYKLGSYEKKRVYSNFPTPEHIFSLLFPSTFQYVPPILACTHTPLSYNSTQTFSSAAFPATLAWPLTTASHPGVYPSHPRVDTTHPFASHPYSTNSRPPEFPNSFDKQGLDSFFSFGNGLWKIKPRFPSWYLVRNQNQEQALNQNKNKNSS